MDELPNPQPSRTNNYLSFLSNKRLVIIISVLIILLILGIIVFTRYTTTTKVPVKISQQSPTPTPAPSPFITYKKSAGIITLDDGKNAFAGTITEKGNDFLLLKGTDQEGNDLTVKAEIRNIKMPFWELSEVLNISLQEFIHKKPIVIYFSQLKTGDILSVTGKASGNSLIVESAFIYK